MTAIFVDADACPVKEEVYRVARRYGLTVHVVSNGGVRVPPEPLLRNVIVEGGLDRADDWIADHITPDDIAVTADIPLAHRCVKRGARAIAPDGRLYTEATIGAALATRNLMTSLREAGTITGGGKPFARQDRTRFLNALDATVQASRRQGGTT